MATSYCPTQESKMCRRNRSLVVTLAELSQDFRRLRRRSAAAPLHRTRVLILLWAWMFVPCFCCVLPLRPADHFFRGFLATVCVYGLQASKMGRSEPK